MTLYMPLQALFSRAPNSLSRLLLLGIALLASLVLVWAFWLPLLSSRGVMDPKDVQPICTSLGQVLVGYFAALLGGYFLAMQINGEKRDQYTLQIRALIENNDDKASRTDWVKEQIQNNFGFLQESVRARLGEKVRNLSPPTALASQPFSSQSELEQRITVCKLGVETANALSSILIAESNTLEANYKGQIEAVNAEVAHFRKLYLLEGYKLALAKRELLGAKLSWRFEGASAVCLSHALLCFWPDVILYQTLPRVFTVGSRVASAEIPTGVVILFVAMVLASTYATARLFLRVFVETVTRGADIDG